MRIGELAQRASLRASAIRYYEELGLLPKPTRVSGRREYGEDAVDRLRLLAALQSAGFSLAEIRGVLHLFTTGAGASERWHRVAKGKLQELDETIKRLRDARRTLASALDCACAGRAGDCDLVAASPVRRKGKSRALRAPAQRRR